VDAWFVSVRVEPCGDHVECGVEGGAVEGGGGVFVARALCGTEAMLGVDARAVHRL
jgi:hypothetical protein